MTVTNAKKKPRIEQRIDPVTKITGLISGLDHALNTFEKRGRIHALAQFISTSPDLVVKTNERAGLITQAQQVCITQLQAPQTTERTRRHLGFNLRQMTCRQFALGHGNGEMVQATHAALTAQMANPEATNKTRLCFARNMCDLVCAPEVQRALSDAESKALLDQSVTSLAQLEAELFGSDKERVIALGESFQNNRHLRKALRTPK